MTIIQNAIDSIQIGIEDYQNKDNKRSISAVRNIFAGILLLYKEKLCRLSPDDKKELLIKQYIIPIKNEDGDIVFVEKSKGKKTVDIPAIQERFDSLGIYVDWKLFKNINDLRNDIEHYYTKEYPDVIREIIAKSFLLIRDFIIIHLEQDPHEMLGNKTWTAFLKEENVFLAEEKSCKESINAVDWMCDSGRYIQCPQCHSSLIQAPCKDDEYPTIKLHCKSCTYDFCYDDLLEQCIKCPSCRKEFFSTEYKKCLLCGHKEELLECRECNNLYLEDEDEEIFLCPDCKYDTDGYNPSFEKY